MTTLTEPRTAFERLAPQLVDAAAAGDPQLRALIQLALQGLRHYDLPIGAKVPTASAPSWVAAFHYKLESPNHFMRDWRIRSHIRKKWAAQLWKMVGRVEGVASREGLIHLGHAPQCQVRTVIQVARLVHSSREFLRDEDNTSFCTKGLNDALKDVKLIREDRREWFRQATLIQDVSLMGTPVTFFILRPADAGLF